MLINKFSLSIYQLDESSLPIPNGLCTVRRRVGTSPCPRSSEKTESWVSSKRALQTRTKTTATLYRHLVIKRLGRTPIDHIQTVIETINNVNHHPLASRTVFSHPPGAADDAPSLLVPLGSVPLMTTVRVPLTGTILAEPFLSTSATALWVVLLSG